MSTILIVDDAAVDRRIAGGFVAKAGWSDVYAENGREALEVITRHKPDAVLTDLQMPEMDGLQLVEAVRRRYPGIPVILMTAFGSEEIAAKALRAGAASYVPKKNLQQDLEEALRAVLATVQAKREKKLLRQLLGHHESHFILGYEAGGLAALVNHFQDNLAQMDFGDEADLIQLGMALSEALNNAVDHGNLELDSVLREAHDDEYCKLRIERAKQPPYCDRRVYVTERLSASEVTFIVRDEGPGFDPSALPDPTDPENLLKPCGRGVMLIRTFMDQVNFSAKGNEITMVKRRAVT